MDWLNYHHLYYFHAVARAGSIAKASAELHVSQPTISAQLKALEESLGEKLFTRVGRRLELTSEGRSVAAYAEEIFGLGRELVNVVRGRGGARPLRLVVGVTDVLPKLIVYRLLKPIFALDQAIRLVCVEDKHDRLLADLAAHSIDVVLADAPAGPGVRIKAFNYSLGDCGMTFLGTAELVRKCRKGFPRSLSTVPLLLPAEGTPLRRTLEQWFDENGIVPMIRGEFQDSALVEAFGKSGAGAFAMPTAVESEVVGQFGIGVIGRVPAVRARFYAISVERKLKHPGVVAICETARKTLFA